MPDPRLASWAEMCSIGRAFVARHPTVLYSPTSLEFREMVAVYLGSTSPLAARLGVGRPVRSPRVSQRLLLDQWGFALTVAQEPAGASTDSWRAHHDALAHLFYGDAKAAGLEHVRTEVRGLFSDLLPPPEQTRLRQTRDGLVPDAMLRRASVGSAAGEVRDHLHDLKVIHFAPSRYSDAGVRARGAAGCAERRAEAVHGDYDRTARQLDESFYGAEPDPLARPIWLRLSGYPRVRGHCIGAFGECSSDVHALLQLTASSAAERHWRSAGVESAEAARSTYIAIYRRRWGAEVALQGARLRLAPGIDNTNTRYNTIQIQIRIIHLSLIHI